RIFGFKKQQLRHDQVGSVIVDRADKEHHPFAQQPGVDVVRALAAPRLFDHNGHIAQPTGDYAIVPMHGSVKITETRSHLVGTHDFVEWHGLVRHGGLGQHMRNDVVFDDHSFDFSTMLWVGQVVGYNLLGFLVVLGELLQAFANLVVI